MQMNEIDLCKIKFMIELNKKKYLIYFLQKIMSVIRHLHELIKLLK